MVQPEMAVAVVGYSLELVAQVVLAVLLMARVAVQVVVVDGVKNLVVEHRLMVVLVELALLLEYIRA
jgi:hypothetical protein